MWVRTFVWHLCVMWLKSGISRETKSVFEWLRESNQALSWICNAGNEKERTVGNKCLCNMTLPYQQEASVLKENRNHSPYSEQCSCQVPCFNIFFKVSVSRSANILATCSIFMSPCREREKGRILLMCHTLRLMVVC